MGQKKNVDDCVSNIVLDAKKVSAGWIDNNRDIICSSDENEIRININDVGSNSEAAAGWLGLYSDNINYINSYNHILECHTISSPFPSIPDEDYKDITLARIAEIVFNSNQLVNTYEKYLSFNIGNDVEVKFQKYRKTENCFSIPLFNGIAHTINNPNPTFQFAMSTDSILFFRVKDSGGMFSFYDISQKPPLIGYVESAL